MVAQDASRGIQLPHHRRSNTSKTSRLHYSNSTTNHRHEVHQKEHSNGSWLRSDSNTDNDNSDTSDRRQEEVNNTCDLSQYDETGDSDERRQEVTNPYDETLIAPLQTNESYNSSNNTSPVVPRLRRSSSFSRQGSKRVRRSTRQSTARRSARRSKRDSNTWHIRTADQVLKEAEAYDLNPNDVASYAAALLQNHIQTIKDEELVLDWSSPSDNCQLEEIQPACDDKAAGDQFAEDGAELQHNSPQSIKNNFCNNYYEAQGIPTLAFPPSLIKWPGKNNNKKRRLSEIKKQVKLLSSIIKMTIEGAHEQQHSSNGAGGAGGFSNPAPFSPFVDMSTIPGAALANASAEDSFLPTIDEITEHLRSNKVKEAKAVLRSAGGAVTCPTRPTLWREMCKRQTTEQFSDSFYFNTLQQIYGTSDLNDCRVVLPQFVDPKHLGRGLTPDGISACGRIISVLAYYYPPITFSPALHPLAASLLLYMNESDVYNSLSALICSSKVTFATQTKTAHEVAWRTTLVLARRHVGGAFSTLEKYCIDSKQVENGFQNWLWWILEGVPVPHMIRIMDCFLMEGWKVLVRVALAIFHLYIRQVSRDSSSAALLSTKGLAESIMIFCQTMTITPAKLLKTAFGIRALSKSEIHKAMTRIEQNLKRSGGLGDNSCDIQNTHEDMTGLHRAVSLEGLPTATAQADVQMLSHTLNVQELLTIWNWMPVRMTMYQPSLLYTTEEHGSSLTTFYQRCERHEPTILLVRTTCDHVFGAYCSASWDNRHKKDEFGHKQTYYGTGESFLFTLRPVPAKYQWVGITQQQANASLSHVKHSSELFMHGDDEMITIGGGEGQGIMLDHDLQFGKTENCLTFDNPPLCSAKDFEIKVVEVYGIDITNS